MDELAELLKQIANRTSGQTELVYGWLVCGRAAV